MEERRAEQIRKMDSLGVRAGFPVEVDLWGNWVAGEVTHAAEDYFLWRSTDGKAAGVTVDTPEHWRV